MKIEKSLSESIQAAFKALFDHDLPITDIGFQPTRKEFKGSHTFVTFPFGKISKLKPDQTGEQLGRYLKENSGLIEGFNVVKGFLNLEICNSIWLEALKDINETKDFGQALSNRKKVMVEYSSPNTNKPLHLGHLRNNFLGYSVSRILEANGYEVQKVNLINDRGIHICKSMLAYQRFGEGETPESSGIKGDHLVGKYYVVFDKEYKKEINVLIEGGMDEEQAKKEAPLMIQAQEMLRKWEQSDPAVVALWKSMNEWVYAGFNKTYSDIGVAFDKFYYESNTYLSGKDIVQEGLEREILFKKDDNSVWIDLTAQKLDEKILLRGDGTSVYITQDLGTAELKYADFPFDKSIYVVGNEQDYHFQVLFTILKKFERPYADGMYHLSYGMVDLPSGKMKSREGTVVDADDLVSEMIQTAEEHTKELGKIDGFDDEEAKQLYETIGLGALKYFLLKVDPKKRMLFDPKESIEFQGHTGPFIQYTHARISAILRKAAELNVKFENADFEGISDLSEAELELIQEIYRYPERVKQAGDDYSPAIIANYVFDLAKTYNRFYQDTPILNESDPHVVAFRVLISKVVKDVVRSAMGLLGIEVPERM